MAQYSVSIPNSSQDPAEIQIASYVWQSAEEWRPVTSVLLSSDGDGVHVHFNVQDQFVLARTQEFDGPVYEDSCVEFFFTPSPEPGPYCNIEVNAAGGLKFNRQSSRGVDRVSLSAFVRNALQLMVSPGTLVVPEHEGAMDWAVSYCIPWELLEEFGPVSRTEWRGNFYKCAEANSHPHFGSWSPIDTDTPDFHRPEFFGAIYFQ